ncbi:MAG: crossover junction endodeoxyribonuclease RuvC [Rikenellaceae bacterium]
MVEDRYRILGIDPGTNYMGYGVIEVRGSKVESVVMGVIDLHRLEDPYAKLKMIFDRVGAVIEEYKPRDLACESPFFGENVQSMLKLGRAQGVVMAAALSRGVDIFEYAPTRVKQSVTGSGGASKEQLAAMICSILSIESRSERLDATDGMAVALCHYFSSESALNGHFESGKSKGLGGGRKALSRGGSSSWEAFVKSNPEREVSGQKATRREVKKPF